jgi:hypothetical protein
MCALICLISVRSQAEPRVLVSSRLIDAISVAQSLNDERTSLWLSIHARASGRVAIVLPSEASGGVDAPQEEFFSLLDEATSPRIAFPGSQSPTCPANTRGTPEALSFVPRTVQQPSAQRRAYRLTNREDLQAFLADAGVPNIVGFNEFVNAQTGPYVAAVYDLQEGQWSAALRADFRASTPQLPLLFGPETAVRFQAISLANAPVHIAEVYEATVAELVTRYMVATSTSNYAAQRDAFIAEDGEAWVIEASGPRASLFAGFPQEKILPLEAAFSELGFLEPWITRHAGQLAMSSNPASNMLDLRASAALSPLVSASEFDTRGCFSSGSSGPSHPEPGHTSDRPAPTHMPPACTVNCRSGYHDDDDYVSTVVIVDSGDSCGSDSSETSSSDDSCSGEATSEDDEDCSSEDPGADSREDACSGDSSTADEDSADSCAGDTSSSSDDESSCSGDSSDSSSDSEGCGGPAPDADDAEPACSLDNRDRDVRSRPKRKRLSVLTLFAAALALPLRRLSRRRARSKARV